MTPKRGFYVVKGLNRSGRGECEFKITVKRVTHLETHGPTNKFYELLSACDVLKEPMGIFEGLQRQGQEKGLCYVGSPKRYGDGWSAPGHKNMARALKLLGDFGLFFVEDGSIRLSMIFIACMAATPEAKAKKRYVELGKVARETSIPAKELQRLLS